MTTISLPSQETLWTKNFIFVFLSNLFLFFGFQMLIPTLPVYVYQHGGTDSAIGLVTGIFTFSSLLIRPFSGMAIDTMNKKVIAAVGLVLCFTVISGYYLATTVLMILFLRVLHGMGWGIATTTYGTIASDIVPLSRRGEGMGYFGLSSTIAMSLAPILGIWLMNSYGFGAVFTVSVLSTLIALFLSQVIYLPQIDRDNRNSNLNQNQKFNPSLNFNESKPLNTLASRLIEKTSLFPSLLILLLGITYGGIAAFITLFGKESGIENVGWFFFFNALFSLLVRPISGKVFDRYGHFWVLILGGLSSIIGIILLSLAATSKDLMVAAAFYGIGFGSVLPSIQAWVINRAAFNRRGAANATFYSAFDLGIGGGAIILSLIAGLTNYARMYQFSALFLILFVGLYLIYAFNNYS